MFVESAEFGKAKATLDHQLDMSVDGLGRAFQRFIKGITRRKAPRKIGDSDAKLTSFLVNNKRELHAVYSINSLSIAIPFLEISFATVDSCLTGTSTISQSDNLR